MCPLTDLLIFRTQHDCYPQFIYYSINLKKFILFFPSITKPQQKQKPTTPIFSWRFTYNVCSYAFNAITVAPHNINHR